MKRLIFVLAGLSLMAPTFADSSKHPMVLISEKSNGSFYVGDVPKGFTALRIERPKFSDYLRGYFARLEHEKAKQWKEFVKSSDEYAHLSKKEREAIANNPFKNTVAEKFLVDVTEVYKILNKDGKTVGYIFNGDDHVQAAIYQDGAGSVFYLDENMEVLVVTDWSA